MNMSVLETVEQMTVEEKQHLFDRLWADLNREDVHAELTRREERVAQGLNRPLPFEEVAARLRERFGRK